jgi:8-oxo-dGTP diphosphatase
MGRSGDQGAVYQVALDLVVLSLQDGELHVLMEHRAQAPYAGFWALPEEFKRPGRALDEQARDLLRRIAARGECSFLEQLKTFDRPEQRDAQGRVTVPGRDPRGDVISVAYLGLVPADRCLPAPDAALAWKPVRALPEEVGFDHRAIIDAAVRRLRGKIRYSSVAFALLPEEFTLSQLHRVYEQILGRSLHRANFQRDVLRSNVVELTGERNQGRGRPAHLFRFRHRPFGLLEEPEGFE